VNKSVKMVFAGVIVVRWLKEVDERFKVRAHMRQGLGLK